MKSRGFGKAEASDEAGCPRPAGDTGWKPTYLLSFFFICWPWSHVRTRSSHFCDGRRKNNLGMSGEARASLSARSPSPCPGPAAQVSQQDVWLHTEELQGEVRVENIPRKPKMATAPGWWSVSTP